MIDKIGNTGTRIDANLLRRRLDHCERLVLRNSRNSVVSFLGLSFVFRHPGFHVPGFAERLGNERKAFAEGVKAVRNSNGWRDFRQLLVNAVLRRTGQY